MKNIHVYNFKYLRKYVYSNVFGDTSLRIYINSNNDNEIMLISICLISSQSVRNSICPNAVLHLPSLYLSTPIQPKFPSSTKMAAALDLCHGSLIRNRVWARNIFARELLKTLLFVRYRDNSSNMGQDQYIDTTSLKRKGIGFKFSKLEETVDCLGFQFQVHFYIL